MPNRFSFDGALMHFARTEAPRGFFWKYAVSYILLYAAAIGLFWLIAGNAFLEMMYISMQSPTGQVSDADALRFMGAMGLAYLVAIPVFIAIWAVLEGALQRRYVRLEPFALRFGGDELRLILVGLVWGVLIVVLYFTVAFVVIMAVTAFIGYLATVVAAEGAGFVPFVPAILVGLAAACLSIWLIVRLSPAAALTVRDRRFRFFEAWAVTRGRFWPLLAAYLVLMFGVFLAASVLQLLFSLILAGAMMGNMAALESGDLGPVFTSGGFIAGMVVFITGYTLLQAGYQFIAAGIPAHAANTDPRGGGLDDPADAFE